MAAARPTAYTAEEIDEFLARKKALKNQEPLPKSTDGEFNVIMEPNGLYRIEHASGRGVLPRILEGYFTSINKVNDLIAHYKTTR